MTTHDIDIDLPPLPEWMNNYTIPSDDFEHDQDVMLSDRMHDYARAAVEADRKSSNSTQTLGESECNHCGGTGDVSGEYPGQACPVCNGTGDVCTGTIVGIPELLICGKCDGTGVTTTHPAEPLVDALERIASWPDGGNQYGQENIKKFASNVLSAYRKGVGYE